MDSQWCSDNSDDIKCMETMGDGDEMKNIRKTVLFLGIFLAAFVASAIPNEAQVASPPARATCKFADGKTITVNYSSPRMRGRKIFGDLVPFGEVWRAGADDATSFVSNADLIVGGKLLQRIDPYRLQQVPSRGSGSAVRGDKRFADQAGNPIRNARFDAIRASHDGRGRRQCEAP